MHLFNVENKKPYSSLKSNPSLKIERQSHLSVKIERQSSLLRCNMGLGVSFLPPQSYVWGAYNQRKTQQGNGVSICVYWLRVSQGLDGEKKLRKSGSPFKKWRRKLIFVELEVTKPLPWRPYRVELTWKSKGPLTLKSEINLLAVAMDTWATVACSSLFSASLVCHKTSGFCWTRLYEKYLLFIVIAAL